MLNKYALGVCLICIAAIGLSFTTQRQGTSVYGATVKRQKVSEYEIKAVYLYNFVLFVEWPEDENRKELTIGILGKDKFGDSFNSVSGKKIKNKHLEQIFILF